jgi:hypothetical protein
MTSIRTPASPAARACGTIAAGRSNALPRGGFPRPPQSYRACTGYVAADSGAARSDLGDRTGRRDVRNQSQRCMREAASSGPPGDAAGRLLGSAVRSLARSSSAASCPAIIGWPVMETIACPRCPSGDIGGGTPKTAVIRRPVTASAGTRSAVPFVRAGDQLAGCASCGRRGTRSSRFRSRSLRRRSSCRPGAAPRIAELHESVDDGCAALHCDLPGGTHDVRARRITGLTSDVVVREC